MPKDILNCLNIVKFKFFISIKNYEDNRKKKTWAKEKENIQKERCISVE